LKLHFQSYGRGEPLIVLHGLFGSLENWHSINQRLGEDFQVWALDQRNHGRSPHSAEMNYTVMAEDVKGFMEAQALERAGVMGHSMGGKTAMELALRHPAKVVKLVVVDIAPRTYAPRHEQIFAALLSLNLGSFQTRRQMEEALAPTIPNLATRQFLLKNVARDAGGAFRWKNGLREIHQNYDRLGEALQSTRPFEQPALFIRGGESDYLQEEDMGLIRRAFPRAQLATVPGAGHLVHTEKPDAFVRTVRSFLLGG
jgi:esterase